MRQIMTLFALVCLLPGCNTQQETSAISDARLACQLDAAGQPILAGVLEAAVPSVGAAVTVDTAIAHPLVVAGCTALAAPGQ